MASMASRRVLPLETPDLVSLVHPLYQGMLHGKSESDLITTKVKLLTSWSPPTCCHRANQR